MLYQKFFYYYDFGHPRHSLGTGGDTHDGASVPQQAHRTGGAHLRGQWRRRGFASGCRDHTREKFLPQVIIVNNRVGGAGVVGFSYFKTKRGDPYVMMSVTGTVLALAYRPDINIGLENYTPLALFAIDPQTIMVPADSPYKTFKDLMERAQASRKRWSRRRRPCKAPDAWWCT